MKKLNPITVGYLKILEFISYLLIEFGGKYDNLMHPKNLLNQEFVHLKNHQSKMKRIMHSWGDNI